MPGKQWLRILIKPHKLPFIYFSSAGVRLSRVKAGTVMCRCLGFSNTLTQFPSISIQQRTCFIQLVLKQNPQSSPLYHSLTEGVFHQFPGASGGGAYGRDVTTGRRPLSVGGGFKLSDWVSGPAETSESGFSETPWGELLWGVGRTQEAEAPGAREGGWRRRPRSRRGS